MVHHQRGAKVTRYNKKREEAQNIQRDNEGQALYSFPHYITENINGDICTSEYLKQGVQVVDKNGQHKFFYTGKDLRPFGICTNVRGHILVCDVFSDTIHILDEHGQFLSRLLMSHQNLKCSGSVCVDEMDNLYVGQYKTNKVIVYKYLPSRHATLYQRWKYVDYGWWRWTTKKQRYKELKKDVENLTNFQRQYDVLYSKKYRPKHNIKILSDCIVFVINVIISLD